MFPFLPFTLFFLQGLTPEVSAPKTSAPVNQKHIPAPECNGESCVGFSKDTHTSLTQYWLQNKMWNRTLTTIYIHLNNSGTHDEMQFGFWGTTQCFVWFLSVSGENSEQPKASRVSESSQQVGHTHESSKKSNFSPR